MVQTDTRRDGSARPDRAVRPQPKYDVLKRSVMALAVAAGGSAALGAGIAVASASPAKTQTVVKVVAKRSTFKEVLVTTKGVGATLYELLPKKTCTGGCLSVWPPLTVAKGTTPEGVKGLGTVAIAGGKLQVTFNKHPLYTFVSDSGSGATGNCVSGFVVAVTGTESKC